MGCFTLLLLSPSIPGVGWVGVRGAGCGRGARRSQRGRLRVWVTTSSSMCPASHHPSRAQSLIQGIYQPGQLGQQPSGSELTDVSGYAVTLASGWVPGCMVHRLCPLVPHHNARSVSRVPQRQSHCHILMIQLQPSKRSMRGGGTYQKFLFPQSLGPWNRGSHRPSSPVPHRDAPSVRKFHGCVANKLLEGAHAYQLPHPARVLGQGTLQQSQTFPGYE